MASATIYLSWLFSAFMEVCAYVRRLMLRILAVGPIPTHIAIIMDGNRRFADRARIERSRGHLFGYDRLIDTLKNCLELGVKYVSVYAFSIDNFGRSEAEVNCLMNLMEEKLDDLIKKDRLLKDFGVRVQVIGDLTLLPVNVRAAAERAMAATRENSSVVLNLCVAYTSTAEIANSIQEIRDNILMAACETEPCPAGSLCGQMPASNGRRRVISRSRVDDYEDSANDRLDHERRNGDVQPNGLHSNFAVRGRRNVDTSVFHDQTSFRPEIYQDDGAHILHNGGICPEAVNFESCKEAAERHRRLGRECRCGDEMVSSRGMSDRCDGLSRRKEPIAPFDFITENEIENHLYTAGCPPPDLLIRTSGETRLSNFMLWQCSSLSRLAFCKVLWPEFSLMHLAWIILDYQRAYPALQEQRRRQEQFLTSRDS